MHLSIQVRGLTLLKVGLLGAIVKSLGYIQVFFSSEDGVVQLERGALYGQLWVHQKALAPRNLLLRFKKRNANG